MSIWHKLSIVPLLYACFVFVQSLFFKFTNSFETQYIFGKLNDWIKSLGLPGLFARTGIFSQYVIGSAELCASLLMLASLIPRFRELRPFGALLGLAIISGAVSFHLFTPLGTSVLDSPGKYDHGLLFGLACGVWVSTALLVWLDRDILLSLAGLRQLGHGH